MKIKLEDDLTRLSAEEVTIKNNNGNYEKNIDVCVWILKNLDKYYDVAVQICRKERASKGSEKGKHTFSDVLSCQVESEGFEPSSKHRINKLSTCVSNF